MPAPCHCGGETQLEHYDPPRGIEWFLRCLSCGAMSETKPTADLARHLTIEKPDEAANPEPPDHG